MIQKEINRTCAVTKHAQQNRSIEHNQWVELYCFKCDDNMSKYESAHLYTLSSKEQHSIPTFLKDEGRDELLDLKLL